MRSLSSGAEDGISAWRRPKNIVRVREGLPAAVAFTFLPHSNLRFELLRREVVMSNLQRAKDIYTAFARGDVPTVLAIFHPAIEWREAEGNPYQPDGAAWLGPQSVLEKLFINLGSDWEGFAVNVGKLHEAGEHVVMEGRYTGRYKPSGKSLDAQVCHVLRFQDNKLASFQQYVDTAQLQTVMSTK